MPAQPASTRERLLDAAVAVVREKGFQATTVDELCAFAGVTKGAFFHHFPSKEALAIAAAEYWGELAGRLFSVAPYHGAADPVDRLLGYLDFRKAILKGRVPEYTCLVGTMVQETYDSHPAIRDACARSIREHAATLEPDIREAIASFDLPPGWTAASLAMFTQAVLQGAFILAKASGSAEAAADAIDHLRRYIELLVHHHTTQEFGHA